MPRASKKNKGKGVSTSGATSNGVRNSNYTARLEHNLGRTILSERNIDLNNLIESEVPFQVEALGWTQFVTTAYHINERLVREFYAAMDPKEFEKGVPVKVRGVDVGFSAHDINVYYGTRDHTDLDTGVPKLRMFSRYNLDLARELRMPHVDKPWDDKENQLLQHDLELIWAFWVIFLSASVKPSLQITITVVELAKLLYCIKHHVSMDVGQLIRRAMIRAASLEKLVLPFPALVTYFCEQAGLFPEERDRIAQMDGPLNSRTFNDISYQRNQGGLRSVATRKRQRREAAAQVAEENAEAAAQAAEEDPGAVPAGDGRPEWVSDILQGQTNMEARQTALEQRQTTLEQGIADLTKAIRDSYLSFAERYGGAGPS